MVISVVQGRTREKRDRRQERGGTKEEGEGKGERGRERRKENE